jgi:hypothetical protein
MASAAPVAHLGAPRIFYDSRNVGLLSIMEDEVPAGSPSPLSLPSSQAPSWRRVEYFDSKISQNVQELGVLSAFATESPSLASYRSNSPRRSPGLGSARTTSSTWNATTPLQASPLVSPSPSGSAATIWEISEGSFQGKLSSVIPDITDYHAAVRKNSLVELEIMLRRASNAQVGAGDPSKQRLSIENLTTEESDILGPLHSPLLPLTPSMRSPLSMISPRASSECIGRGYFNNDQTSSIGTPSIGHSPLTEPPRKAKKSHNLTDLRSFSFGHAKGRKESSNGHDPLSSPRRSQEGDLQRPSSAHLSCRSSVESEVSRDVMLVNPITGERKMSIVKPTASGEQLRQPSILRRTSSAKGSSMYTLVRRDSVAAGKVRSSSTTSRLSDFGYTVPSIPSWDQRHTSATSSKQAANLVVGPEKVSRTLSLPTRHMSCASDVRTTSIARTISNARHLSHSSYARTASTARTMSNSSWSRAMSTFTRASSMGTLPSHDVVAKLDGQPHDVYNNRHSRRKSSSFVPMFGDFQWNKRESIAVLPVQEPEPAYQEALAGLEEDPDFVEVVIRPKAGSLTRRASLLANIFSDKDVDVDPDLEFEPSASEKEIKQGITEAQAERTHRKMVYSRNVAVTSFTITNVVCVALSFGIFSVWYALVPLILMAPLLRSATILGFIDNNLYHKIEHSPQVFDTLELPIMDYATILQFSNESRGEIESSLDSVVNQRGLDMHKSLMFVSCNDQVLDSKHAKSTTRILLEHIFTNIIDEARFRMPREDEKYEFDTMWCRRGIYKGLPYVLMIKEGATHKIETFDMIRNLLHSYNLRKQSYHNSVPDVFFAWIREWAELHDFISFDFLVSIDCDTSLDERCISELYRQTLRDSMCVGVSSRVQTDPVPHPWSIGSLFENNQHMYHQSQQASSSRIMKRATTTPRACQLIRICEETCAPHILGEIKSRRPLFMSNVSKQIRFLVEENDMMMSVAPEFSIRKAVHAVALTRPSTSLLEFFSKQRQLALSACAVNISTIGNNQTSLFQKLLAATEILTWCLPFFSLALIINFLRAAALGKNVPVLVVISVIVAGPWFYSFACAMRLADSWRQRLRHLIGFPVLVVASPFVAIYAVASALLNLHHLCGPRGR